MSCLAMSCALYVTKNVSNANINDTSLNSVQTNNTNNHNATSLKPPLCLDKLGTTTPPPTPTPTALRKKKPRQPSIIEIERAVGAGRFRNTDPRELEEDKDVKFDMHTMSFPERFEGPLQKRLRETGEWMIDRTEKKFRMSGKKILKFTFLWILPIWALAVLVASGAIKLPFSNQFIDQLIM